MSTEYATLEERDGRLFVKSSFVWYDEPIHETLWFPVAEQDRLGQVPVGVVLTRENIWDYESPDGMLWHLQQGGSTHGEFVERTTIASDVWQATREGNMHA